MREPRPPVLAILPAAYLWTWRSGPALGPPWRWPMRVVKTAIAAYTAVRFITDQATRWLPLLPRTALARWTRVLQLGANQLETERHANVVPCARPSPCARRSAGLVPGWCRLEMAVWRRFRPVPAIPRACAGAPARAHAGLGARAAARACPGTSGTTRMLPRFRLAPPLAPPRH